MIKRSSFTWPNRKSFSRLFTRLTKGVTIIGRLRRGFAKQSGTVDLITAGKRSIPRNGAYENNQTQSAKSAGIE